MEDFRFSVEAMQEVVGHVKALGAQVAMFRDALTDLVVPCGPPDADTAMRWCVPMQGRCDAKVEAVLATPVSAYEALFLAAQEIAETVESQDGRGEPQDPRIPYIEAQINKEALAGYRAAKEQAS